MSGRSNSWKKIVLVFSVAQFIEAMFWGHLIAFLPLFITQLGIASVDAAYYIALITAGCSIFGIIFLPLWGALADKYGRKPLIVRTMFILLAGSVSMSLAASLLAVVIARAITEFSLGSSGLMMTSMTENVPDAHIGISYSIMNSVVPFAVALGPLLGGPVVDRFGFHSLMGIDCGLLVLTALLLMAGFKERFQAQSEGSAVSMAKESLKVIVGTRSIWRAFLILSILFCGPLLADAFGAIAINSLFPSLDPATRIGWVMGLGGFATMLFGPAIGWFADRFGLDKVLRIAIGINIMLWLLPLIMPSLPLFATSWGLGMGMTGGIFSNSFGLLTRVIPDAMRARIMSFAYLPIKLASIITPIAGAMIFSTQNIRLLFPLVSGFSAIAVLMLSRKSELVPLATDTIS